MLCQVNIVFSYLMVSYLAASLIYLVATRCIGTPFNDSLTPTQKEIKKRSGRTRGVIFLIGFIISLAVTSLVHPFEACVV